MFPQPSLFFLFTWILGWQQDKFCVSNSSLDSLLLALSPRLSLFFPFTQILGNKTSFGFVTLHLQLQAKTCQQWHNIILCTCILYVYTSNLKVAGYWNRRGQKFKQHNLQLTFVYLWQLMLSQKAFCHALHCPLCSIFRAVAAGPVSPVSTEPLFPSFVACLGIAN